MPSQENSIHTITINSGLFGMPRVVWYIVGICNLAVLAMASTSADFSKTSHCVLMGTLAGLFVFAILKNTSVTLSANTGLITVTKSYLGFDKFTTQYDSKAITSVTLKETYGGRDNLFSLRLDGIEALGFFSKHFEYEKALLEARTIAKMYDVKLHIQIKDAKNRQYEEEITHSPTELKNIHFSDKLPKASDGVRFEVNASDSWLELKLPKAGWKRIKLALFAVSLIAFGFPLMFYVMEGFSFDRYEEKMLLPQMIFLVALTPAVYYTVLFDRRQDRIMLSSNGLALIRRNMLGIKKTVIPIEQLKEISISFAVIHQEKLKIVVAPSKATTLKFGYGLSDKELIWLRDTLHQHVARLT